MLNVAFIQSDISYLNPEENRSRIEYMLEDEEDLFPDLVVLPELMTSGYFFSCTEECEAVAEYVPEGPTTDWLLDLSQRYQAHFVAGIAEMKYGILYNSAVITGPEGHVGTYRKTHLYYQEKIHFASSSEGFPVYSLTTNRGLEYKLGVMICFDWYYPEAARTLALRDADIIAHPSNLVRPDCPRAMPIRALENHLYTVTANRLGKESNGEEELTFIGQSRICDPDGQVLVSAEREEAAVKSVRLDPKAARDRKITPYNDLLRDRRPELYD